MRRWICLLACWFACVGTTWAACCYFAALDKDVNQPGQRAFITWDDESKLETFTVQPSFEGNAADFGMVIPTPAKPKLQEMPRDFFKALAVFTILEPMDISKFKSMRALKSSAYNQGVPASGVRRQPPVRVLEAGVVGSLDYKILEADRSDALFEWLKQNQYSYSGDQKTLEFYVTKKWNFTVMKIDPRQMKRKADGSYTGDITPTRFTFKTRSPIYPLHITQISVKDSTDCLLYIMARTKMDLPGKWSYQGNFLSMWGTAMSWAVPEKLTAAERQWLPVVQKLNPQPNSYGAQLEWAGKLTPDRLGVLTGKKEYNREAPPEEVKKLKLLRGHLKEGWYLTKLRKRFDKAEMTQDLALVSAKLAGQTDDIEYISILPTSPP